MTDENQGNEDLQPEKDQQWPEPTELSALDESDNGTIMDIEPSNPNLEPPSLDAQTSESSDAGVASGVLDASEPAPTLFQPTEAESASPGAAPSNAPAAPVRTGAPVPASGAGLMTGSGSGSMGGVPVAPFGGKIVVGTRISQIEVTGVLGKGGMGEVFKGYHHALDIDVAIKVLPDELSRNELVRQRFLREARLCVKLDHPHIVRVYNVDEYAGNLYLVMEMIDGTDAAHMLKDGGRFAYTRALRIGEASAEALACAHGQGLVHRDVKPHNILLGREDGKIKISDFGLARAATSSSHLTMSGQIMGTPHYMSPEQAESKEVTDKSDVYSLGVAVYHMLTGETPFIGDTPISVAVQHIAKEVLYPELRFKVFPSELVAVLKRMTAKDPTKRCSAKQAAVWLRKLIEMAPDDDIAQQPEVMQTMAPVVRESQAFAAARQAREQQDERAREMARTMLATMHEADVRQPSAQVPQAAESTAPVSRVAVDSEPASSGKGGAFAATIAFLLIGGGGLLAWQMGLLGIGPQSNATNGLIAVTPPTNNSSVAANSVVGTNNAPDTNSPESNGNDGEPPINCGPEVEPEDEKINQQLADAATAIAAAQSVSDLETIRSELDSINSERGLLSERQRNEYESVREQLETEFATYTARELNTRLGTEITAALGAWDQDVNAGIRALNIAIDTKAELDAMNLPPAAESQLAEERKFTSDSLAGMLDTARTTIFDEALKLGEQQNFEQAAEKLAIYNKIHLSAEEKSAVSGRIAKYQVHDLIKRAGLFLDGGDYDRAGKTLDAADKKATSAELQDAVASARKAIKVSVSRAFDRHVENVDQAISGDELDKARDEIDKANELPLTTQQTETLTSRKFIILVSSHILDAESAIKTKSFKAADESINAAALEIDDGKGKGKTVPADTTKRLERARSSFDAELQVQFDNLLEAARSELAAQDFEGASQTITKANNLPLNQDQRTTLEEFSQENTAAFESYVSDLLKAITTALKENDFESARLKLEQAESLSMPEDLAATLENLKKVFNKEAVNRHTSLLNDAKAALDSKRYSDARAALDEAASIPVDAERKNNEAEYNTRYTEDLNAEVTAMLVEFDGFLESGKFLEASDRLDAAEALPLDSELKRKVKLKREKWDTELEQAFVVKLKSAEKARDDKKFRSGSRILKEAEALPLGQAQLERLSKAEDAHKKALGSHIDALFKQLEAHVKAGREKDGKLIGNKLEAIISSLSHQNRLKKLRSELTGESAANRLKRLPDRMKKLFGDAVCSAEQVMWVGEEVSVVYVSADGKFAAAGTETGKVMFYNLKRGTSLGTSRGGRRKITAIGISPDGTRAMCGNDEGDLVSFTLDGSNIQTKALTGLDDDITAITYGTGKNSLWVLTDEGDIVRYNPVTAAKVSTTPSGLSSSTAISISPNGSYLAVGGTDAEICVFNTSQMTLKKKLQGPGDDPIQRLSFSSNSKKLVAGSEGDGIGVWETSRLTEDPVKEYEDLPRWVTGVGFNSTATRVVALDDENQIRIFDTKTGKKIKTVKFEDFQDEDRDVVVTSGFVASDGTILFGTSEGEIYHFTLKK